MKSKLAIVENVTEQEFREIFVITSDNLEESDESDIDFEGFEINSDGLRSDSDDGDSCSDFEDEDHSCSSTLRDVYIPDFLGDQKLNATLPEDAKADDYFRLLFSEDVLLSIVTETNRFARDKLSSKPERLGLGELC